MSKEKILLYAFLGLMLTLSACQHHDTTDEENTYEGKEWTLSDQISNKKVKSICEDQYGQIWIGTFRGLNMTATSTTNTSAYTTPWGCPTTISVAFSEIPKTDCG